jgi:hypothetical protein
MRDCAGERVGGVRRHHGAKVEQPADHFLYLLLRSLAMADDSLLHLQRRVFGDREVGEHRGGDRGAARLAQQERRLRVDVDEDLLDGDFGRPVLCDHRRQVAQYDAETLGQFAVAGADAAARHANEPIAREFDDAEPRHAQAGIDAEDAARGCNEGARGLQLVATRQ